MNIASAKFIKGIIGTDDILYNGKYQIAFIGRSNVGKSTVINSLTGKPTLSRSSKSPGKTVRLDFFLINDKFYFVDLPGYGYARRPRKERESLAKMILWYLRYSKVKQRLVILIIDAKVGFTDFDRDMIRIMKEDTIEFIVVANKVDALTMSQKDKQIVHIQDQYPDIQIILYSAKKGTGRDELLRVIDAHSNIT